MKDFTKDSLYKHILFMAIPIALNMILQTMTNLVGVYVSSKESYLQATQYLFWFVPLLSLQVIYTAFIAPMYAVGLAKASFNFEFDYNGIQR